jgi:hypothetical protein
MNKRYIALLTTMFCMQQMHGMEQQLALKTPSSDKKNKYPVHYKPYINAPDVPHKSKKHLVLQHIKLTTPPSNDDGYPVVYKPYEDMPIVKLPKEVNEWSEQLYGKTGPQDISLQKVEELLKAGANPNYLTKTGNSYCPIPIFYAFDRTKDGVKKMQLLIEYGAKLKFFEDDLAHSALAIAVQEYGNNEKYHHKNNNNDMIRFLMLYETPEVTIYQTGDRSCSVDKNTRDYVINHCIGDQNIEAIKMLFGLQLATPTRLLKDFVYFMKPNETIFNFLLTNGAQCTDETFTQMIQETFPFDQYIEFTDEVCEKLFNTEALQRMLRIQKHVDSIVENLTKNKYPSNK